MNFAADENKLSTYCLTVCSNSLHLAAENSATD